MTKLIRRLRGALGIGLTWGVLWIVVGSAIGVGIAIFQPEDIGPGEGFGRALPIFGLVGFLSGLGFAILISLAERRRTIERLSGLRVMLWGVLGSAAVPLLIGANPGMGWITGPMGALFAATTIAIARRGTLRGANSQQPLHDAVGEAQAGLPQPANRK